MGVMSFLPQFFIPVPSLPLKSVTSSKAAHISSPQKQQHCSLIPPSHIASLALCRPSHTTLLLPMHQTPRVHAHLQALLQLLAQNVLFLNGP